MEGLEDRQLLAGDLLLVNHFDLWDGGVVPSSDVAGVAYHAPSGHLYLSDSEINEIPSIFDGDNAFEISLTGDELFGAYRTGNSEPTGITYNEFDGFFYVTNDDTQRITRYDSTLENSHGSVKTTSAVSSAKDPEGITSDPITGTLYVVDGSLGARQVLVYTADLDYQYRFSVKDRMADSEGIALNPYTNTLFIVSEPDMSVFEYTVNGGFINQYDISGFSPSPVAPQGLTFAPTSDPNDNPNALALYIADGMKDNYADGRIYEAIVLGAGENGPPLVHAGADQTIAISDSVALNGTVSDDGLPGPPAGLTTAWTMVSGPGTVTFNNPAAVDTTASFSQTGSYVLQLTADDGELAHSDQVTVTVTTAPVAPVTVSFQDGVGGYSATRDTSITGDMPTTNLGALNELEVDGRPDYAALMAWDIRAIPAGSTILSASITVQVTNPSNAAYELYELKQNWSETEATWEAFASGSNWQAAGAQGSNDMGSTVLGQANMPSTGKRTITLNQAGIALVQAWVDNAAGNHGIIVQDYVGPTNGLHFSSREVSNTSNRPKLTIEYQPIGPQPDGEESNLPPQVDAGPDQAVPISDPVALSGTVSDDGLPDPPNNVTTAWTKVSGPGTVTFNNAAAVNTSATFSHTGSYVLQLTADDSELTAADQVTVTVGDVPVNQSPQVNAGPDQSVLVTGSVTLHGTVNDDGLPDPPNNVTTAWTQVSGPGTVTFNNAAAVNTSATFSHTGSYVLQLAADDGELSNSDQLTVTVANAPAGPVTVSFQDGVGGYSGTRDTSITGDMPTTNLGTLSELEVDGRPDYAALMAWDIRSIPTGSTILSASITLQVTNPSNAAYELYEMKQNWSESEATWQAFASGSNWQAAGAQGSNDMGSTVLGQANMPSTGKRTITLNQAGIALVQAWVDNAASNHGVIVQDYVGPTNGLHFSSREVSNTSNRPKLTIEYQSNGPQANAPPQVNAGPNQSVLVTESVVLSGTVNDDGLPDPPNNIATTWTQVSGPGTVTFTNAAAVNTSATFSQTGSYVLQLTADDSELTAADQVTVTVSDVPVNQSPQVNAGPDQSVLVTGSVTLHGTVNDDGLPDPPNNVTTTWTQVSGPGTVTFNNAAAVDTSATFSQTGSYVLQLTADDGELSNSDQLTVSVANVPAGPVTVSFQDGVGGYSGTRDTSITGDMPTTNLGTLSELEVDGRPDYAALMAWDISTVPTGSSVLSASITVNVTNPSDATYEIYELKRGWSETEATWTAFSSGSNWQAAGAQGPNDMGSTILGQANISSTGKRTITLNQAGIALVQSWVDNAGSNHGLIFQDYVGPTNGLHFDSREVSNTSNRPELRIQYEPL